MNVRFVVDLTREERDFLTGMTRKGKHSARRLKRAHILLLADEGQTDDLIAQVLSAGTSTVYRTRRRFVEQGLEEALSELGRPGASRCLSAEQEATLIATACTTPPEGRACWTMQLLADRLVMLNVVESVSADTIRRRLSENELKPWQQRMWCVAKLDAEYLAKMEDVLALYAKPRKKNHPLVCFDETLKQLVEETRSVTPAAPGRVRRFDYEYRRNGTANLFMFVAPLEGWRHVKVTERRGNQDFAECMRDLVDIHFPKAKRIRVVLDNLNTHRPNALYKSFPAPEAQRILKRIEFHYTPKHGSWLNMAEIEIGILARQCLARRIPERPLLEREVAAWNQARNDLRAGIQWMFDVEAARKKFSRAYAAVTVVPDPLTMAEKQVA